MGDNLLRGNQEQVKSPVLRGARIIIVLGPLELGGSERQALLLARYLAGEWQCEVHVWGTLGEPGRVATLCDEYGIQWRVVPFPWSEYRSERVKRLARFTWMLRGIRPNAILPYMALPNMVCGLVWRWTGAQTCIWNQRDDGVARLGTRYEPWAVSQTPRFIANSVHGARFLTEELNADPNRVRVIRNGVELGEPELDRRAWRDRLGVANGCFLACMVANLHQHKDHATLLRAWKLVLIRLQSAGYSAALLLAGRFDNTHESLKALAADLEISADVKFLGAVNDIPGLLSSVDLGVFSSRTEGSPNGLLECMAAGLAVAATDIPGIREAVGQGGQPFLAPPGDAQILADRILKLAVSPALRAQLGEANRRRIVLEFNPRRMCEETSEVIVAGLRVRSSTHK